MQSGSVQAFGAMDRVAMVARCPLEAGCQMFRIPEARLGWGIAPECIAAKDDSAAIAAAFGADLGSVAAPDLSCEEAQAILRESLVTLPGFDENIRECGLSVLEASQFQFWGFLRILQCNRCFSGRV